jgi:hypothetical protein
LLTELGIDRFAKYRALRRLAVAGIITVKSYPQRSLEVVFHRRRRLDEHFEEDGALVLAQRASLVARASYRSGLARPIAPGVHRIG